MCYISIMIAKFHNYNCCKNLRQCKYLHKKIIILNVLIDFEENLMLYKKLYMKTN